MADEPVPDSATHNPGRPSGATSVEHNKAVSRRWVEAFNERDDAAEADVRGPDFVATPLQVWSPSRWIQRPGPGFSRDSSRGSRIFGSRSKTRLERAAWSRSACTSRARTPGSFKAYRRANGRSPASGAS